jgi:hypothetical protein
LDSSLPTSFSETAVVDLQAAVNEFLLPFLREAETTQGLRVLYRTGRFRAAAIRPNALDVLNSDA